MLKCPKCGESLELIKDSTSKEIYIQDKFGNFIQNDVDCYSEMHFNCSECNHKYKIKDYCNSFVNLVTVGRLFQKKLSDNTDTIGIEMKAEEILEMLEE